MDNNVGKIFLGGLPRNCTEETLTQYFTKFGEIMESTVVRDNVTGNSRGFGFIKFKDPDSVQTALAAGNHTIDGKSIDAKPLKQKTYGQGGNFGQNSSVAGMMGGGGYQNRGGNGFGRGGMMRGPQGERRGPGGDAAFNHRPAAGDHPFKLFIGGLPRHGCDEGTLREYFGQYGNVTDILIPTDRESRQPKGYAFITYETEEGAARATEKRFQEIMNKKVEVKRCEQRGERSQNKFQDGGNSFMQHGFGGGSGGGGHHGGGGYQGGQHSYGGPGGGHGGYDGASSGYGYGNPSGGYGGQGNSSNSYAQYQGDVGPGYQGGQGGRGGQPQNQMMGYNQGQSGGGGGPSQSGQYPGQNSSNMAQPANSTVPFNAAGGPQSSPSTNAASAQYAQYAMWYAMQQQAAAAAAANSSNPAGAAALAGGASSGNASTSPAMGTGGQDLAANYQNYLLQYQQQNSNASQQALAGMGGSSTAPSGVPPPTVGVPPPSGGAASSQASAASNAAFNFGYPNQQPGAFGQVTPSAGTGSAAPNSSAGNPAAQAQGSNPEFYTAMYAQYIAALSNQQQSSNAAASGAHGR